MGENNLHRKMLYLLLHLQYHHGQRPLLCPPLLLQKQQETPHKSLLLLAHPPEGRIKSQSNLHNRIFTNSIMSIVLSKKKHILTFFFISSCSFLLKVLFATAILPILKDLSLLSSSAYRRKQSMVTLCKYLIVTQGNSTFWMHVIHTGYLTDHYCST